MATGGTNTPRSEDVVPAGISREELREMLREVVRETVPTSTDHGMYALRSAYWVGVEP